MPGQHGGPSAMAPMDQDVAPPEHDTLPPVPLQLNLTGPSNSPVASSLPDVIECPVTATRCRSWPAPAVRGG